MRSQLKITSRRPGRPPTADMVWIPGGTFTMGSHDHYPEEAPAHEVTVDGFWMDRYTVTNGQFRRFVGTTGYVTVAERQPDPADYPGIKPELLVPASVVFRKPRHPVDLREHCNWWVSVPGADWRLPKAWRARSRIARAIPSGTSPGTTPSPAPAGSARTCRPRPNGSSPRAAPSRAPSTPGR